MSNWCRFFFPGFWGYVFSYTDFRRKERPSFRVVWCRILGHPNGVVYYTMTGTEPDMHCKDCGEDLG